MTIGVLALQGAFDVHASVLRGLGVEARLVRRAEGLDGLDGLVMPGGESTTLLKHLERGDFFEELRRFAMERPTFGTCAGCILLAKEVLSPMQRSLGVMDVAVERNAYGRQIDSTIVTGETRVPGGPLEMVFIRAPRIVRIGEGVETLAERDGSPVLVREGHLLAATFHPELSADARVHALFAKMVAERAQR